MSTLPTILILGAADTGRAPMTAAILAEIVTERALPYQVASAGILGHDGDSPTGDAISTMDQMGLDITEHVARSLTDELTESAALLISVDSGTARVARARFPHAADRIHVLGDLAGRARDIPDPFKMAMAAWLTYASEIKIMLHAAIPRILTLLGDPNAPPIVVPPPAIIPQSTASDQVAETGLGAISSQLNQDVAAERVDSLTRIQRLLDVLEQMPGVVDWSAARAQIAVDLDASQATADPADLAPALVGLLRAVLSMTPTTPTLGQVAALREAVGLLTQPVTQPGLAAFSVQVGMWAEL